MIETIIIQVRAQKQAWRCTSTLETSILCYAAWTDEISPHIMLTWSWHNLWLLYELHDQDTICDHCMNYMIKTQFMITVWVTWSWHSLWLLYELHDHDTVCDYCMSLSVTTHLKRFRCNLSISGGLLINNCFLASVLTSLCLLDLLHFSEQQQQQQKSIFIPVTMRTYMTMTT